MALKDLIVRGSPAPKPSKARHAKVHPIFISKNAWMYPLSKSLTIVHEIRDEGKFIRTETIEIKWVEIKTALERHERMKKKGLMH